MDNDKKSLIIQPCPHIRIVMLHEEELPDFFRSLDEHVMDVVGATGRYADPKHIAKFIDHVDKMKDGLTAHFASHHVRHGF